MDTEVHMGKAFSANLVVSCCPQWGLRKHIRLQPSHWPLGSFLFVSHRADWFAAWLYWAKWATWPPVRRRRREKIFLRSISVYLRRCLWHLSVNFPGEVKSHSIMCTVTLPINLISTSSFAAGSSPTALSPAGQEKRGNESLHASPDCLCLVIFSVLAQTGAKSKQPHTYAHTPTICQRPGRTEPQMSAIRSHVEL